MKLFLSVLLLLCCASVFGREGTVIPQAEYCYADSLVAAMKEYKELYAEFKKLREDLKDMDDSVRMSRYYLSDQDKCSRGIKGGVLKYELGNYKDSLKRVFEAYYYVYYALAERKIVLVNDRQQESTSPQMQALLAHMDSIIIGLPEYMALQKEASASDELIEISRTTIEDQEPDCWHFKDNLRESPGMDTLTYTLQTTPSRMPCAGPFIHYTVLFSVKADKVVGIKKEQK